MRDWARCSTYYKPKQLASNTFTHYKPKQLASNTFSEEPTFIVWVAPPYMFYGATIWGENMLHTILTWGRDLVRDWAGMVWYGRGL